MRAQPRCTGTSASSSTSQMSPRLVSLRPPHRDRLHPPPNPLVHRPPTPLLRLRLVSAHAISIAETLADGRQQFNAGDRMGAVRTWESALDLSPTPEEAQEVLWHCTCIHASFGDLELAKMTLRDAIGYGLDFDSVVDEAPMRGWIALEASTQVKIQLRNFATQIAKGVEKGKAAREASAKSGKMAGPGGKALDGKRFGLDTDAGELLATEMPAGMDVSVGGVVKRVAGLLALMVGLGVGLYVGGLRYFFADF